MILLFDLDRTIIDTEIFKRNLAKIFDISLKEYDEQVDSFFRNTKIHYSPEEHIKILRKIGKIKSLPEERILMKRYFKLLKKMDMNLFPKTKRILSDLKRGGHKMFLITLGASLSQKRKVIASGIEKYFDKIIYETKNKSKNSFIKKLSNFNQDVLIINDKATEAIDIKKVIGTKGKIFLVKGPHCKNISHQEKIYKDISKIKDAIKTTK